MSARTYLDNAATTWPKPEGVLRAVEGYLRTGGSNVGRGSYRSGTEADEQVGRARRRVAELLGGWKTSHVLFTGGCTDSLNLVLHGFVRPGDHLVTTVLEHNSILRPARALEAAGVEVSRVGCDAQGFLDPDELAQAVRPETRLAAVSQASNVTGALQPLAEISARLRQKSQARLLVDAAQSLGHVAWDPAIDADFVACSGHKGLLGLLGVGILAVRPGLEADLLPQRQGGTGSRSDQDLQPAELPDRYESGSPNVPGIVALSAGLEYLAEQGVALEQASRALTAQFLQGLAQIPQVTIYGPARPDDARRVGVVSFNLGEYDPRELAAILDSHYGLELRAGLHCAPRMHQALGTLARGGAVRWSVGPFNTAEQVELSLAAIREAAAAL